MCGYTQFGWELSLFQCLTDEALTFVCRETESHIVRKWTITFECE